MITLLAFFLFSISSLSCPEQSTSVQLITLPEDREKASDPFISFLDEAKTEILLASYKLQEKKLPEKNFLDALQRAHERGVTVHLISENRLTSAEVKGNDKRIQKGDAVKAYEERGVQVHPASARWSQSHTKFIIVDRRKALLGTTNFDKEKDSSRDFSIQFSDPRLIRELHRSFWADVNNTSFKPRIRDFLWGPEGQREALLSLIDRAENSIRIYQQDITDSEIVQHLILSAKNGVDVEVIMTPYPFGPRNPDNNTPNQMELTQAGGHVFLTTQVKVHAKVMIIDDQLMYLGSTNFYEPAIDTNRNVGLLTTHPQLIRSVLKVFEEDKKSAIKQKQYSRVFLVPPAMMEALASD